MSFRMSSLSFANATSVNVKRLTSSRVIVIVILQSSTVTATQFAAAPYTRGQRGPTRRASAKAENRRPRRHSGESSQASGQNLIVEEPAGPPPDHGVQDQHDSVEIGGRDV